MVLPPLFSAVAKNCRALHVEFHASKVIIISKEY